MLLFFLIIALIWQGITLSQKVSEKYSFLIITIDTWRWDYIGISGSNKVLTPNLDKIARDGLYEREIVTPCPLTTPAHASIFTGVLPHKHGILDCVGFSLKEGVTTLAQIFKKEGYLTAAFVSSDSVLRKFGLDRGFDIYDDTGIGRRSKDAWQYGTKDGALTTKSSLDFITKNQGKPLFVWIHYFDLHAPYRRRPEFDAKYPNDIYAAEASFVDGEVGKVVSHCTKSGKWKLIIVGDHGEGLGDHGEFGHGMALYRSTAHIPLIIYPKPEKPLIHPKPWGLTDIYPTVMQWFGFIDNSTKDGESLFDKVSSERLLPMMTLMPTFTFAVEPVLGVRKGNLTYLKLGSEELYDLEKDPNQTKNLCSSPEYNKILENLREKCNSIFPKSVLEPIIVPNIKNSPEELKDLMGLGYIGGAPVNFGKLKKASITDLLADWNFLQKNWEEGFKNKNPISVKNAFGEMAKKYPEAPIILRTYGKFCLKTKDYSNALITYEKLVKCNPQDEESLVNLGTLYLMQGKVEKAKIALESALKINPDDPVCRKNLGLLYGDILKQPQKAIPHYKRYLELEPSSPDAQKIKEYILKESK
ncbi:MAG: sulfatase-like hydrolase/transferase [Acidobacteria bacterium]|nr:sulfatase-like hydrolase/transferase [Acidobacteriota bacterium]